MNAQQIALLQRQWELRMQLAWNVMLQRIRADLKAKEEKAKPGSVEAEKLVAAQVGAWFQDGWVSAMTVAAVREGKELRSLGVPTAFDGSSQRTMMALQDHRLRLVRGFSQEQTKVAQTIIQRGLIEGRNPIAQAREIRESIGLTEKQEAQVHRYRTLLETRNRRALQYKLRDARFDPTVARAIEEEKPLAAEQVERMVTRYRERMVKLRAETIARTESMRALHTGTDMMYRQAVDEGTLGKDEIELEWITAKDERVRPSHLVMNGQRRKVGEPFITGLGNLLYFPADPSGAAEDTINCRCSRVPRHRLFAQFHTKPTEGAAEAPKPKPPAPAPVPAPAPKPVESPPPPPPKPPSAPPPKLVEIPPSAPVEELRPAPVLDRLPTPPGIAADFVGPDGWKDLTTLELQNTRGPYLDNFAEGFDQFAGRLPLKGETLSTEDLEFRQGNMLPMVHAIGDYKGMGYTPINKHLRGQLPPVDPSNTYQIENRRRAARQAELVQQAILQQEPTKFDMVVFRGDTMTFEPGVETILKGFTSTSLSKAQASFFEAEEGGGALYEIKIPAGSRVLGGFNSAETEILLPHNSRFRVLREYEVLKGRRRVRVFQLEYLGVAGV